MNEEKKIKKTQNEEFSFFLNLTERFFTLVLDKDDTVSLYTCKKIIKGSNFIYNNITAYFTEQNAINALFISINLAIIVYQNLIASWFMYLVTSKSGMKKLFKVIFQNPILGIFFYFSFYFNILIEQDKNKFNFIAKTFDLPLHDDLSIPQLSEEALNNIAKKLSGEVNLGYTKILSSYLIKPVAKGVESIPSLFSSLANKIINGNLEFKDFNLENAAVYISSRTLETQAEMDEIQDYIFQNIDSIKKNIKTKTKNKTKRTRILEELLEIKDEDDNAMCLDKCQDRVKTVRGCYCESECSPSLFFNASWCYVDPNKCRKTKHLPKFLGKPYDNCDPKKTRKKCFTGTRYRDCVIKK